MSKHVLVLQMQRPQIFYIIVSSERQGRCWQGRGWLPTVYGSHNSIAAHVMMNGPVGVRYWRECGPYIMITSTNVRSRTRCFAGGSTTHWCSATTRPQLLSCCFSMWTNSWYRFLPACQYFPHDYEHFAPWFVCQLGQTKRTLVKGGNLNLGSIPGNVGNIYSNKIYTRRGRHRLI